MAEHGLLTGDVHLVRRMNRDVILKLVREQGPISRTALARKTRLTPATAFSIVEELVQQGLVQGTGIGPSQGGRRPMLFEFNPRSYGVIGVDIRSAQVLGLVTDLDARPEVIVANDYDPDSDVDVVALTAQTIRELIAASPFPRERLMGIGVAVPGLIDVQRGVVVESRNWNWTNLPLRDLLIGEFDLAIYMEVDDKALAVGEAFFGSGRGIPNTVCIKIGRGLGAGLVMDSVLVRGADNMAGEIEHILVDPEGPRCFCGNYGCLTALVSASAITGRAVKGLKLGAVSSVTEAVGGRLDRITVALIADAARAGDPFARQIMEETGRYLGIAVAMLVNLLNPDRVIIGGGVIQAGSPLIEPIRQVVRQRTYAVPGKRVSIVPADLGVEAPAVGAAAVVMIQEGALPARGFTC